MSWFKMHREKHPFLFALMVTLVAMAIAELAKQITSEIEFESLPWTLVIGAIAAIATLALSIISGDVIRKTYRSKKKDALLRNEADQLLSKQSDACEAIRYLTDRYDGGFFLIIQEFPYDVYRRHIDNVFPGFTEARRCFEIRLRKVRERSDRIKQNMENDAQCLGQEMHDLVQETIDIHNDFVDWRVKLVQALQDFDPEYHHRVDEFAEKYRVNYKEAVDKVRTLRNAFNDSVTKGKMPIPAVSTKINEREIKLTWRTTQRQ